ncbi:MAG TPA: UDP-N-acetylglucosamine 1-carboxyvinyltransferase, partial [Candidatus Colwellbacteria bacterium]|nr:UDP-N-acetylglucosamine 1-carboxyvinyltransferase [Candidatus Colwellbacteria bacterium]
MPQKFIIKGGNPLKGEVRVRGAKNSISKLLIASLLTEDEVKLTNVPLNQETEISLELCENIGSIVKREADTIVIRT